MHSSNLISGIFLLIFIAIIKFIDANLFIVYLLTFILSFINGTYRPARLAIMPAIVNKDILVKANDFFITVIQILQTAGWVLAFPLANKLGVTLSLILISFCYIFSSFIILGINVEVTNTPQQQNPISIKKITDGIAPFFEHKLIKSITIMDIIENFANVIWMPTFLLAFTINILEANEK